MVFLLFLFLLFNFLFYSFTYFWSYTIISAYFLCLHFLYNWWILLYLQHLFCCVQYSVSVFFYFFYTFSFCCINMLFLLYMAFSLLFSSKYSMVSILFSFATITCKCLFKFTNKLLSDFLFLLLCNYLAVIPDRFRITC